MLKQTRPSGPKSNDRIGPKGGVRGQVDQASLAGALVKFGLGGGLLRRRELLPYRKIDPERECATGRTQRARDGERKSRWNTDCAGVNETSPDDSIGFGGNERGFQLRVVTRDRNRTQCTHDFGIEASRYDAEPREILRFFETLARPQNHVTSGVPGKQGLEAMAGGKIVPEILTASGQQPGLEFARGQRVGSGQSAEK